MTIVAGWLALMFAWGAITAQPVVARARSSEMALTAVLTRFEDGAHALAGGDRTAWTQQVSQGDDISSWADGEPPNGAAPVPDPLPARRSAGSPLPRRP